jgi:hypothetical protein
MRVKTINAKSNTKSGEIAANHHQAIRVKSGVKAGKLALNHNQSIR